MVLQIRRNFQVTLPSNLRKRLRLSVGDVLETEIREGKIILVPKKMIDAEQSWFWSKQWQEGEKEAQEDIKQGRVKKFKNVQEVIEDLDK